MTEGVSGSRARGAVRALSRPFRDLLAALDGAVAASRRPWASLALLAVSASATWVVYVPVHELMHAAGCSIAGGDVRRLTIQPVYGGRLLAAFIPFVEAGGDHAGRLADFSTGRSDLRYLATDAAPYLLSIALGVPLLRASAPRRSAAMAGAAAVVALAPFVSLAGDYYEMGSILVSRAAAPAGPAPEPGEALRGVMKIRSDDLPALVGAFLDDPAGFAAGVPGGPAGAAAFMGASFLAGAVLAGATYAAGAAVADRLVPDAGA